LPHPPPRLGPAGQHGVCHGPVSHLDLALFVAGAFAAAFVTGLAGFAFAIVAAAVWLHFLPPAQATPLIVAFGLIVQGVSVWKLRRAIQWKRLMPFLIGGVIGVPLGAELLRWAAPGDLRIAVGAILVLFSLWNLFRPSLASMARAGAVADGAVGLINGVIGGATGFAGVVAIIWCSLRGWPPAEQRAVFQPSGVAVFLTAALWFGGAGMIGGDTLFLFLIGLPGLAIGTWAGLKLFGKLNDQAFRRIVLVLLLISGASLLLLGR
jgi:uncharacterized membrane protein YfcA